MFLLNKAFTHWAQSASDEVARTNIARRHILRTRYFNAWRDITAVNELKCRRVGLRKWFPVWRAKTAKRAVVEERAVAIYEEKLVEKTYWNWFWSFCDRKAPVWKETRSKRSALRKLAAEAARVTQMDSTAANMREFHLTRRTLGLLVDKARLVTALDHQATSRRQTSLLSLGFNTLQKHSQLAPQWRKHEQEASSRLAVKTIYTWSLSTTLARRAEAASQQRILRNVMTTWNDSLRIRAVTALQDERIKAEAWYKWMLHERYTLFRRITAYRLLERTLSTMSVRLAEQNFRLGEAEAIFHQGQRRRTLQSVMLKMNRKARNEEHLERVALEFRNERIMHDIIPTWCANHKHVQKLERWSEDARFYCLTHSTIRRWKEATTNVKRVKRRDAYATVRRRVKINLVQNCFSHWRQRSANVTQANTLATDQYQSRLFALGTTAFDQWHRLTAHLADLNMQAEDFYTRQLFAQSFIQLQSRGALIVQNYAEAENYASQTVHLTAKSEMLRRMKWELFRLKRNKENAAALKDRNAQQHHRNMLRFWAEQAVSRRILKNEIVDPESPTKTPSLFRSMRLPSARKPSVLAPSGSIVRPATTGQIPRFTDTDIDGRGDGEGGADADADADADRDLEDDDLDFGASTVQKAEEWTSYDFLKDFNSAPSHALNNVSTTPAAAAPLSSWQLPTLNEESEPSSGKAMHTLQSNTAFATPLPGYLRTPSKRTVRQRTRFKPLSVSTNQNPPAGVIANGTKPAANPNSYEHAGANSVPRPASAFASFPSRRNEPVDADVLASTTPAPFVPGAAGDMSALTPQVTPFERKMRAGGFGASARLMSRAGPGAGAASEGGFATPGFGRSRFGRSFLGAGNATGNGTGKGINGAGDSLGVTTGRSVRFFDGAHEHEDEHEHGRGHEKSS